MPTEKIAPEVDKKLSDMIGSEGEAAAPVDEPSYKVIGDSKIPVSKAHGKLWKQRRDYGVKKLKDVSDAWDEAIQYYSLAQDVTRSATDGTFSGANSVRARNNDILTERENIVFANVSAMVPALYAKAPDVTITCDHEDYKELQVCADHLLDALFYKKASPGVNLKPKMRKGIVLALLTNECWYEIGYTQKQDASGTAMQELADAATRLAEAKTPKEIVEIEGQIAAIEAKTNVLRPSGPYVALRRGNQVITDPETTADDCSDSAWLMYYEYLPTSYIQAVYGKKGSDGQYHSIYQPTHVITSSGDVGSTDDQVNNFKAIKDDTNKTDRDRELQQLSSVTKVWYVQDKTTRRIYMYHDENWSWPIWVWDDPYHLDTFFTLKRLAFHTHPTQTRSKGEVSYYLDQVDAISEINDAEGRARQSVKYMKVYDSNVLKDQDQVDAYFRGNDRTALGIPMPEGKKLEDIVGTITPDVTKFSGLFDQNAIQRKISSIDRISSVSDIQRGAQFKTNTTNKAIDAYSSVSNQRIDDRIDAIEDTIGDIAWAILQLCLQFMDQEQVAYLVGPQRAQAWKNMQPEEIQQVFSCRIEGGSTTKPTSRAKKQEVMEVGQVLGQFAQAAPGPTLKIMLRMYERAFDEFAITDQDWEELNQAIFAQQQQGNSTQGAQPGAEGGQGAMPPEMQQQIAQLPPEAKQAIAQAVKQGVPPQEALAEVMKALPKQ
jgi:hypothetical protein